MFLKFDEKTSFLDSKGLSIKICKFDKGKGTAILDKKDYFLKLDDIIEDKSKFCKIENKSKIHPIVRKEKSISYYIKKYLENYDSKITNSLISSGSQPGKLYGLAKVHKNKYPLRAGVPKLGYMYPYGYI